MSQRNCKLFFIQIWPNLPCEPEVHGLDVMFNVFERIHCNPSVTHFGLASRKGLIGIENVGLYVRPAQERIRIRIRKGHWRIIACVMRKCCSGTIAPTTLEREWVFGGSFYFHIAFLFFGIVDYFFSTLIFFTLNGSFFHSHVNEFRKSQCFYTVTT